VVENGSAVSVGSFVTIRVTVGSGELTTAGGAVGLFKKDKSSGMEEQPVRINVKSRTNRFFIHASKD
jgi:hypothetical protein